MSIFTGSPKSPTGSLIVSPESPRKAPNYHVKSPKITSRSSSEESIYFREDTNSRKSSLDEGMESGRSSPTPEEAIFANSDINTHQRTIQIDNFSKLDQLRYVTAQFLDAIEDKTKEESELYLKVFDVLLREASKMNKNDINSEKLSQNNNEFLNGLIRKVNDKLDPDHTLSEETKNKLDSIVRSFLDQSQIETTRKFLTSLNKINQHNRIVRSGSITSITSSFMNMTGLAQISTHSFPELSKQGENLRKVSEHGWQYTESSMKLLDALSFAINHKDSEEKTNIIYVRSMGISKEKINTYDDASTSFKRQLKYFILPLIQDISNIEEKSPIENIKLKLTLLEDTKKTFCDFVTLVQENVNNIDDTVLSHPFESLLKNENNLKESLYQKIKDDNKFKSFVENFGEEFTREFAFEMLTLCLDTRSTRSVKTFDGRFETNGGNIYSKNIKHFLMLIERTYAKQELEILKNGAKEVSERFQPHTDKIKDNLKDILTLQTIKEVGMPLTGAAWALDQASILTLGQGFLSSIPNIAGPAALVLSAGSLHYGYKLYTNVKAAQKLALETYEEIKSLLDLVQVLEVASVLSLEKEDLHFGNLHLHIDREKIAVNLKGVEIYNTKQLSITSEAYEGLVESMSPKTLAEKIKNDKKVIGADKALSSLLGKQFEKPSLTKEEKAQKEAERKAAIVQKLTDIYSGEIGKTTFSAVSSGISAAKTVGNYLYDGANYGIATIHALGQRY